MLLFGLFLLVLSNYGDQGFIQPPNPPPNPKSSKIPPPQIPAEQPPKPTPKNLGVPEVHKMTKVLEDGRENG